MSTITTDHDFVKRLQNGDEAAFEQLVVNHQELVLNTCFGFVHNRQEAEDLTQEVFIQVYKSIKTFQEQAKLSTWLYRIAVNKSLNFIRKEKSKGFVSTLDEILFKGTESGISTSHNTNPLGLLENNERAERLEEAIAKLPENQKTAFTLSKLQGLPNKEISEIMELSLSATEALLNRAKKNLQKFLLHYLNII